MHGHGRTLQPLSPSDLNERATNWAFIVGGVTTAAIGFLVGAAEGSAATAVLSASVGGIVSGAFLKTQLTSSPHARRPAARSRAPFGSTEQLAGAKLKLSASRATHARVLSDKQDLRRRLMSLRAKMEEVALPAYRPRIASIDMALDTIDKQMAIHARLRDGYDKSIAMIDIELESGVAAEQMPEDISATILASVRELQALEASQAELARQLEANVEVEQLLRR